MRAPARVPARVPAEELYREHGPALHRFLVRTTGDEELAGDVLHDAFQRLIERPPGRRENLKAWLFRVAINRLRDVQRRAHRRARVFAEMPSGASSADPAPGPERGVAVMEARRTAAAVLLALSERERQILLMREEGFTHREIAEAVGTTTGSIGTMIARALERVARTIESSEVEL